MKVEIKPSAACGTVTAPPSKSVAHRMLICAGLSEGESVVRNLAFSEDIKATIACLRALGATVRIEGDTAIIKGVDPTKPLGKTVTLPCNESGSTLRFFIPICLLNGEEHILTGSQYLLTRPLSVYEEIAQKSGIRLEKSADRVVVQGKLRSGVYEMPGNVSSQFITGMLFALPFADGASELRISEPYESQPYVGMTADAMQKFGVMVEDGYLPDEKKYLYRINSGMYHPAEVTVEGDYSNAAFLDALNIVSGKVEVEGLSPDSLQGDKVYKILFENIKNHEGVIDIADCPDLGPILFAVAALCGGAKFTGTRRLKIKESDRADAMRQELDKFGVKVEVGENEVIVHLSELHKPTEPLNGHNDHRIVMALSVLLTRTGGVIEGAEAVNKSFPDFFDRLKDLGVDLTYGMDQ